MQYFNNIYFIVSYAIWIFKKRYGFLILFSSDYKHTLQTNFDIQLWGENPKRTIAKFDKIELGILKEKISIHQLASSE